MPNLLNMLEKHLAITVEGDFSLPVVLISPDGATIDTSANTGEPLRGFVRYSTVKLNPDTGEEIVVNNPVIVLRRSSLSRVPVAGETWIVKIPIEPVPGASLHDFVIDPTAPPEGGRDMGALKLFLRRAVQS